MLNSRTSLVLNDTYGILNNIQGLQPFYYRLRSCDTNLTSNTPANQYQRQKIIQNTVRVNASLYTMNLGSLSAYVKPPSKPYGGVCWNQMSDRPFPSVQKTYVPTGKNSSLNTRKSSVTSSRPGCQSPGGVGCDIKHNSYDRYLNRLKGKGPLRRGPIPPEFGATQIQFNRANPIYGAKLMKTNIVNDCNCPIVPNPANTEIQIYNNPLFNDINQVVTGFTVGQYVYTIEDSIYYNLVNEVYTKALITGFNKNTGIFTVQFEDGTIDQKYAGQLRIYFSCDCDQQPDTYTNYGSRLYGSDCIYPIQQPETPVL